MAQLWDLGLQCCRACVPIKWLPKHSEDRYSDVDFELLTEESINKGDGRFATVGHDYAAKRRDEIEDLIFSANRRGERMMATEEREVEQQRPVPQGPAFNGQPGKHFSPLLRREDRKVEAHAPKDAPSAPARRRPTESPAAAEMVERHKAFGAEDLLDLQRRREASTGDLLDLDLDADETKADGPRTPLEKLLEPRTAEQLASARNALLGAPVENALA
ncbi:hypothetical protein M885DRAFT_532204 [Pelagophyceae sp. CCMP2097]|nr:hypothetical protein M885DRAFT_532204 [Pelagophyceae sp. CCMP2097]|mmetsp:Transcript_15632/g.54565  ORF Transcript_15632/g.54565 Transcript_15632/m.54565 type:complete len:218 (-) Transcript_15632:25-678(-)